MSLQLSAQEYYGDQRDIDQILENIDLFSQYFMSGDHLKMANCYTDEGKILPSGPTIIMGKAKIADYWKAEDGSKILHHKIMPKEIRIVDNYAYDYGYYEGTSQNANSEASNWQGKYVIVWKKVGTEWKIEIDIWNSLNVPIPSN